MITRLTIWSLMVILATDLILDVKYGIGFAVGMVFLFIYFAWVYRQVVRKGGNVEN